MKYCMMVVIIAVLITSCVTEKKKKEPEAKKEITILYITNWDSYQLPRPVSAVALRDILEKIALYRQDLYCPFGENQCASPERELQDIVMKIVEDSIATHPKDNLSLIPKKTEKEPENNTEKEDFNDMLRARRINFADSVIDFSYMKNMRRIINLGSLIHNKSMRSALKILKNINREGLTV